MRFEENGGLQQRLQERKEEVEVMVVEEERKELEEVKEVEKMEEVTVVVEERKEIQQARRSRGGGNPGDPLPQDPESLLIIHKNIKKEKSHRPFM